MTANSGSLFGSGAPSFVGIGTPASNLFAKKPSDNKNGSDDDDGEDAEAEKEDFGQPGQKLKIESRPPEKSPYTKTFNVTIHYSIYHI
jgi:hypothetical protein